MKETTTCNRRSPASSHPGGEQLLILDPLERLAPVLRKGLERSGYSVAVAARWQQAAGSGPALERVCAPAAVLVDALPGCGVEVSLAARIAAAFPANPPLVIAVVAEAEAGIAWIAAGAAYMLEFPVPAALLEAVVERAFEIHRERRGFLDRQDRQAEILRGFGHELRNQVNAILGCIQLLETDEGATSSMVEDLALIRRNTRTIIGLAEKLLENHPAAENGDRAECLGDPVGSGTPRTAEKSKK